MSTVADDVIYLSEDHPVEYQLTRKNTNTRVDEPATGLTLTCYLSSTRTGAAIDPAVSISLTEASQAPGTYYGTFDVVNIVTHVTGKAKVYRLLSEAGNIKVVTELTVKDIREV